MKLLAAVSIVTVVLAEMAAYNPSWLSMLAPMGSLPTSPPEAPTFISSANQHSGDGVHDQTLPLASPIAPSPEIAVELAFAPSPTDAALRLIEKAIRHARENIVMAAYDLSSTPVAEALLAAERRGVHISIVADQQENREETHSKLAALAQGGIQVRMDGRYPAMHHKFIVVDGRDVETGSYNYSYSAQRLNAENVVVFWNDREIAARFSERFAELWSESVALGDGL
jgi:phosphatidylserine/phosphatidylglycerophosphate/cardiolipin synthase-like enzyme